MRNKIIFAFILVLFLASRLYKIADIPASVYWDEASIGYNAYSIATDLKDEWGDKLPLHFRAFGEFKLPVYIYSTAILVEIIGLNEYAIRLPAVLYSLGTLIVVYLIVKKITDIEWVGIFASFILSFSPWFFIFSRTGYEVTAGLFFFLLATYLSLLDKSKYLFLMSTLSFILSFYSYNSFRIIIPIWMILLLFWKFNKLKDFKKYIYVLIISLALFLVSLIPIYKLYKFDSGGTRFIQVEITNKTDFVKNYLSHFSPNFLFLKGDINPRSQIPGHGQLFLFEIPLLLFGLIAIFKSKKTIYYAPLITLLLAPIPAALTRESPHALRSLLAAPSFAMISSLGVLFLRENFRKYSVLIVVIAIICYYLSFELYITDFLTKYQTETSSDWQYQYKEIFASQKSGTITDKYGQPYIFALYYLKYPPEKFRKEAKYNPVDKWGFSLVSSFNSFEFK